jgi:hypothetical protein
LDRHFFGIFGALVGWRRDEVASGQAKSLDSPTIKGHYPGPPPRRPAARCVCAVMPYQSIFPMTFSTQLHEKSRMFGSYWATETGRHAAACRCRGIEIFGIAEVPSYAPFFARPSFAMPQSDDQFRKVWIMVRHFCEMMVFRQIVLVRPGESLRDRTEDCIRGVYQRAYGARIASFPELLVVAIDGKAQPICAAGLRTELDGFFSESYLDRPVEQILTALAGRNMERGRIFEVTTLASREVKSSPNFMRQIACLGKTSGFEWSIFTATSRLRMLLRRLGLPLMVLGRADPARIENAEQWGSYYEHSPMVCAVDGGWLSSEPKSLPVGSCHA